MLRGKEHLHYTPVMLGDKVYNYPYPGKVGSPACDYHVHLFTIRPGDDDYNVYVDVTDPTIGYVNCNNIKHLVTLKKCLINEGVTTLIPMNQMNKTLTPVQFNTLSVLDSLNDQAIKNVTNLISWVK